MDIYYWAPITATTNNNNYLEQVDLIIALGFFQMRFSLGFHHLPYFHIAYTWQHSS